MLLYAVHGQERTAPYSRALLTVHMAAFGLMYFGMGNAIIPARVPAWFAELATGGPFRLMRHPIYMGLNLLALGSAIWVPTPTVWVAFALMVTGSDLRGRAEERLLEQAFGRVYREYCARIRRFIPGVY